MQMAMVLTPQKPTQRKRFGALPEGLPGSTKSVVGVERSVRNLGGPLGSWHQGGSPDEGSRSFAHRGVLK
jgi:hypothetical protein